MIRALLMIAVSALLVGGCGKRGDLLYIAELTPLPFTSTRSAIVTVVPQTSRLVVVSPDDPAPRGIAVSPQARLLAAAPDSDVVVILGGEAKAPTLDVVDLQTGERHALGVPGLYDAVTFSPDGRFALLSYTPNGGAGLAARNLNEVALLDLPNQQVTRIQLDTESLAPRSVVFGPVETDRQLVAVALDRGVAVFDALTPTVAPRRISIRPQGSQIESRVLEALFDRTGGYLFIRATALDDVIAVELSRGQEGVGASINFLAGGQGLTDIALPGGDVPGVLALFGASREAFLLDPTGIQAASSRVEMPEPLTTIQPLTGTRVLFYSPTAKSVVAWDVVDGRSGTAVLDAPTDRSWFSESLASAVFAHASVPSLPDGGAALSIVTVEDEVNRLRPRIRAILLDSPLAAGVLDLEARRFIFAQSENPTVVTLDLASLSLSQLTLDAATTRLHLVPEGDRVAAIHGGEKLGELTLFTAGSSDRNAAIRYLDVALTDDLARPLEEAR